MDTEKIELYLRLWDLGKTVRDGLNALAEDPGDAQLIVDTRAGFEALRPYLPDEASDAVLHIFSGEETPTEDVQEAGRLVLDSLAEAIGKDLAELLKGYPHIGRGEAERLFLLWDEMPHMKSEGYQWMFDLCMSVSLSMPLESFQYSMRIFEEQPRVLAGKQAMHPGYVYRPTAQRTFERCPICGGEGTPYFRAFSYRMNHFDYPHLPVKLWMRCGGCGDLYTWKHPEECLKPAEEEREIRPDPARAGAAGNTGSSILSAWSRILNRLARYSSGRDLLEVGIGSGEFLAVALEFGYRPDAVEISPESAQSIADMLGIPIWCGDFLNYEPDKTYSIITMGDVIEHVTDPERALRKAYRLLREDGVLWVSTPNFKSSFSRIRKFNDAMWSEPHHISYFSRDGFEALAAKCGFAVREYEVCSRYQGSMELILTKKAAGQGDRA